MGTNCVKDSVGHNQRIGDRVREAHYSGGIVLNPNDSNEFYLSRQIEGKFEIERKYLQEAGGDYELEWLDIANSQWSHTQSVSQQENIRLHAPGDGQWVVIVSQK